MDVNLSLCRQHESTGECSGGFEEHLKLWFVSSTACVVGHLWGVFTLNSSLDLAGYGQE